MSDKGLSEEEALRRAEAVREQMAKLQASMLEKKKKKKKKKKEDEEATSGKRKREDNVLEEGAPDKSANEKRARISVEETAVPSISAEESVEKGEKRKRSELGGEDLEQDKLHSNKRVREDAAKPNPYLAHMRDEIDDSNGGDFLFDPRLGMDDETRWEKRKEERDRRAFKLVPKGKLSKEAQVKKAKLAHMAFLQDRKDKDVRRHFRKLLGKVNETNEANGTKESSKAQESGLSHEAKLEIVKMVQRDSAPPSVEWWDSAFIPKSKGGKEESKGYEDVTIETQKAFKYVERPAMIDRLVPEPAPKAVPLYLTKDERKRQRRQMRRERQQEMQDKIAAGLIPPPPPKLKHSNVMRVLGTQVVADPTKIQALVESQRQERIREHEMRNKANKRTPQEKWDKKLAKIEEDTQGAITVALYYVFELCRPAELAAQNRFKIDVNAQKQGLTGCVGIVDGTVEKPDGSACQCNVVVVEGGPKFLAKFEKQMLQRIKFPASSQSGTGVQKIWQGLVPERSFPRKLEFHEFENGSQARSFFDRLGVVHYWDMCVARAWTSE